MAQERNCRHCAAAYTPLRADGIFCSVLCGRAHRRLCDPNYKHGVKHAKAGSTPAAKAASMADLAWAAGFLEGEGNFGVNHRKLGRSASQVVRATQKNLEPLYRLQRFLGGAVKPLRQDGYGEWRTYGVRARGIMMTLYSFLSAKKRADIQFALNGGY